MQAYSSHQFARDLATTLAMAAFYSLFAALALGLFALAAVIGRHAVPLGSVASTLGVFTLVYLVAALGSALAVFLLRPLRMSWFGWALTGGLVAFICYGTLFGLLAVFSEAVTWFFALRDMPPPQTDSWRPFLLILGVLLVPVGALFGLYWRHNPP